MHEECEYRVFINSYEGLECIKYHVGNVVYLVPTLLFKVILEEERER